MTRLRIKAGAQIRIYQELENISDQLLRIVRKSEEAEADDTLL
jgi:hypothetical protein